MIFVHEPAEIKMSQLAGYAVGVAGWPRQGVPFTLLAELLDEPSTDPGGRP